MCLKVNGSTCNTPPATDPPQVQVINRPPKSLFKTRTRHLYRMIIRTIYYIIYVPKYKLQDHRNCSVNSRIKFPRAPFSGTHGRSSTPATTALTTLRGVRPTHTKVPPNKSSNSPASSNKYPASSKKPTASSKRQEASSQARTAQSSRLTARSLTGPKESPISTPRSPVSTRARIPGTTPTRHSYRSATIPTTRSPRSTTGSSHRTT